MTSGRCASLQTAGWCMKSDAAQSLADLRARLRAIRKTDFDRLTTEQRTLLVGECRRVIGLLRPAEH